MTTLKVMASRAKSRLLSRGLRETYSQAKVNEYQDAARAKSHAGPFLDEKKAMSMTPEERERYLLDSIMKYKQKSN